ncbi:hypothetical protein GCM10007079_51010 [Nocardiopsis terrae]|uniref:DUF3558 domain-containing protein n=1 Tax=Nocardiopsis terrae TaxID=372655 RepID=A0ABR9HPL0_9ACTN|nr:hypothetical protein [Nocardiopsis terrae]MBE1460956.1 hypothetical protein [Nocardiopsis terrae]GHC97475.1 hypothetical protein GCM10007079_51010 [Nocardiopsis terrae]
MYNGPAQQFPQPPVAPPAPPPRRGGTGRTVAITVAATLGVYTVVAGAVVAVVAATGSGAAAQGPEFEGLPTDPCGVSIGSQLDAVSAFLPSASFSESRSSCSWNVEYSDGTPGDLFLGYRHPTDHRGEILRGESEAEDYYEARARELLDGDADEYWSVEVQDAGELDLGDEAVVSHYRQGSEDDMYSRAEVLVRVGDLLVEVMADEGREDRSGRADFTGDEEALIAIAERAAAELE